jgi:hypothetical protein
MQKLLIAFLGFSCLLLLSCGEDKKDEPLKSIDPADANALSGAITIQGASRVNGAPPSPTSGGPTLVPATTNTTSSNGSSTPVVFSFSGSAPPTGAFVQVVGADSYFNVPIDNSTGATAGQITIPVGLPTNLEAGSFALDYCLYGGSSVSNIGSLNVNVLKLGTGALQISLSWNTATDQDLYVTDPTGTIINYINDTSPSGGALDYDNTSGYGPENIFWQSDAPDGNYSVSVDDFSATGVATTCFVTITAPGKSKTFTVTTQNGSQPIVVSFVKSGSNYSF